MVEQESLPILAGAYHDEADEDIHRVVSKDKEKGLLDKALDLRRSRCRNVDVSDRDLQLAPPGIENDDHNEDLVEHESAPTFAPREDRHRSATERQGLVDLVGVPDCKSANEGAS